MAPVLSFLISSGFKKKEPRCVCLSEAKAPHSHRMWTEVSSSVPHFLQVGLLFSPIMYKCLLKVLCPVSRPITTLDCQFQFRGSVHHTMIIENTSLMQQDKYIFHLYVFSTCFGRDITHHQELQNCTHSDMVMVPRGIRRDVVEEIKWRLARQYYARVEDVKRVERSLVSR